MNLDRLRRPAGSTLMERSEIHSEISRHGVVPVVAIDDPETALPLADALLEGGLPIIEVTFRTRAAAQIIQTLTRLRPALLVGAGTLLTEDNLEAATRAGARFGVAPGLNPARVRQAQDLALPFVPGVATPSEIETALGLGCTLLKFFPAAQLGGVGTLEALAAPYSHTGVKFLPTGGVNAANLESYLTCKAVAAVGGTWIAKKEDIQARNWDPIRQRCRDAVELVRRVRPAG